MTVWYDFTTTIRNRGRNGIANVEWSLGQALLDAHHDVRCFELRGRRGLVELDRHDRLQDAVYASPDAVGGGMLLAGRTWRDELRDAMRARLGSHADRVIRALSVAYQLPSTVRQLPRRARAMVVRTEAPPRLVDHVRPHDVVVSMGADWDGELAERLLELRRTTGCSIVTMVYDLVPLTHTHLAFHNDPSMFVRYYTRLIEASDVITCISEQSRRDLLEFASSHGLTVRRAVVLRLGEAPPGSTSEPPPERGDFFLCVGTIERRKNLEIIYDALRILESEGRALPRVVVVGSPGWGTGDLLNEVMQQSTAASRAMTLLGSVDEVTLDRLYRTARSLLFPSHFEGWGLPVREAAIRGCPVAAGDTPAIREAAAGFDGAVFLSSDDAGPWAEYLMSTPMSVDPSPRRAWATVASDLLAMLPSRV